MKDLFDMTAGTSTGSILAGALSCPKTTDDGIITTQPKFFAEHGLDIYTNEGSRIFSHTEMPWSLYIFCIILITCANFGCGFLIGTRMYDSPEMHAFYDQQRDAIKNA